MLDDLCVAFVAVSRSRGRREDLTEMLLFSVDRIEDETLARVLDGAFRARLVQVMDQSQHTSADTGGEGAAYEFCQGLDTWEKQRALTSLSSARCSGGLTEHG
jgi:hypothetical protein